MQASVVSDHPSICDGLGGLRQRQQRRWNRREDRKKGTGEGTRAARSRGGHRWDAGRSEKETRTRTRDRPIRQIRQVKARILGQNDAFECHATSTGAWEEKRGHRRLGKDGTQRQTQAEVAAEGTSRQGATRLWNLSARARTTDPGHARMIETCDRFERRDREKFRRARRRPAVAGTHVQDPVGCRLSWLVLQASES